MENSSYYHALPLLPASTREAISQKVLAVGSGTNGTPLDRPRPRPAIFRESSSPRRAYGARRRLEKENHMRPVPFRAELPACRSVRRLNSTGARVNVNEAACTRPSVARARDLPLPRRGARRSGRSRTCRGRAATDGRGGGGPSVFGRKRFAHGRAVSQSRFFS